MWQSKTNQKKEKFTKKGNKKNVKLKTVVNWMKRNVKTNASFHSSNDGK